MGVIELVILVVTLVFSLVITVLAVAVPLGIMFLVFRHMAKQQAEVRALLATGASGEGLVTQVSNTGVMINHQPQLAIRMQVAPSGGADFAPFESTQTLVVPMMAMSKVAPGSTVPVKVDPANPSRLAIDWGAMGYA